MIELTLPADVDVEMVSDWDVMMWYGCLVIEDDGRVFSPDDLAEKYQLLIDGLPTPYDCE